MEVQDDGRKKKIKWMVVIIVVLPVLGWLISSIVTYSMPKKYMSQARVELVPSGVDVEAWGIDQYMATEMEVMLSTENLRLVSQMIQLDVRWGMPEDYVVEQLSRILEINRVGGSRMIELRCRHRMKEEARAICMAVYEAYRDRKYQIYISGAKGDFRMLKNEDHLVGNKLEELTLELSHATGTYKGDGQWIGKLRDAVVVKREYDAVLKKKQQLEAKMSAEQRRLAIAGQVMVVHEIPQISHFPVSPNIPLNQAMGMIVGLVAACVVDGILLMTLSTGNKNSARV